MDKWFLNHAELWFAHVLKEQCKAEQSLRCFHFIDAASPLLASVYMQDIHDLGD